MRRPVLLSLLSAAAIAVSLGQVSAYAAPGVAPAVVAQRTSRVCAVAPAGSAGCAAIRRDGVDRAGKVVPHAIPAGYGPATSRGRTRSPAAPPAPAPWPSSTPTTTRTPRPTSRTYRVQFGLPACTTANGCFSKVNQTGGTRSRGPTAAGPGDLARPRHGLRGLPELPDPARRGQRAPRSRTSAPRSTRPRVLGAAAISNSYGGSDSSRTESALLQPPGHRGHRQHR